MTEEQVYLLAAGMGRRWCGAVLAEAESNLAKIVAVGVLPEVTETESAIFEAGVMAGMNSTLALLIREGLLPAPTQDPTP